MTGAGAPGAPGIIECLKQASWINLTIADADPDATGKYLHTEFEQVPKGSESFFPDEVLKLCKHKNIHLILPLVSKELLPLAKCKANFENEGIKILVSSIDAIQIANNKSSCYRFLKSKGLAVPHFQVVQTTDEFINAASELGYPDKPFCFKPSVSNGSRGFRIVDDTIDENKHLFGQKPYNTHIRYNDALRILSSKPFPELLISDYLPGAEYSVDCLAENGKAKLIVPRLRKKMINGISVQGSFIKDEKIIVYCTNIIEAIGLHGNIGIQLKNDHNDQPLLLEINPRVQGTIVAALGAGVNLPLLAVKQELGIAIEQEEMVVRWGTKFWRYWKEVYAG